MKRLVVCVMVIAMLLSMMPYGATIVNAADVPARSKTDIMQLLATAGNSDSIIVGQNIGTGDNISGPTGGYKTYIEDMETRSGKTISLIGCDIDYDKRYTAEQLGVMDEVLTAHWNKGGLVELSWHPMNPWTGEGPRIRTGVNMPDLLDPETAAGAIWRSDLDRIAEALQTLEDSGVTVLWRPLHEMNGSWFWWGYQDQQQYKDVWMDMYTYFTQTKGLDNLIWIYSPNLSTGIRAIDYYYPGDAYVDVNGIDIYNDTPHTSAAADYAILAAKGKPVVFAEAGPGTMTKGGVFDNNNYLRAKENFPKLAYFMTWSDWDDITVSFLRNSNAEAVMNSPYALTIDELDVSKLTNRLSNPGFEDGLTGWTIDGGIASIVNSGVHSGTKALCVSDSNTFSSAIKADTTAALEEGTYRFSAYAKAIGTITNAKLQVLVDGNMTREMDIVLGSDYDYYAINDAAVTSGAISVALQVVAEGQANAAIILDDLKVVKGNAAQASIPATTKFEMENASVLAGLKPVTVAGGTAITPAGSEDYAIFKNLEFNNENVLEAKIAASVAGCNIEVRLDTIGGTVIGNIAVPNTGGSNIWSSKEIAISELTGTHDIYFIFNAPTSSSLVQIDYIQFKTGTVDSEAPTVPSGLTAQSTKADEVTVSWSASTDNVGVLGYDVYMGSERINAQVINSTTYTVGGLTPDTDYTFTVVAKDAALNESSQSSPVAAKTIADIIAPSAPAQVRLIAATKTSALLEWDQATDDIGVAGYRIYENETLVGTISGENKFEVTGLTKATTYNFAIEAFDMMGNSSVMSTPLVVITSAYLSINDTELASTPSDLNKFTYEGIWGAWTGGGPAFMGNDHYTDQTGAYYELKFEGTKVFVYGKKASHHGIANVYIDDVLAVQADFYGASAISNTLIWSSDLLDYGTHTLRVEVSGTKNDNSTGKIITADRVDIDTSDGTPEVLPAAPVNLTATDRTASTVTLEWDAVQGVSAYNIYSGSNLLETVTGVTTANITELNPATAYEFEVRSIAGELISKRALTPLKVITLTSANEENTPPVIVGELTGTAALTSIHLDWEAVTDDGNNVSYEVYKDSIMVGKTMGTEYAFTGLPSGVEYTFDVYAVDSAKASTKVGSLGISTTGDSIAPTAPSQLTSTEQSSDSITLEWNTSVDNVGVTEYEIYLGSQSIATVTAISAATQEYVVNGLQPSTQYFFTVKAKDALGNNSEASNVLAAATRKYLPNLIENPGFEDGSDGWVLPATAAVSQADKNSGLASLRLTGWTEVGIKAALKPDTRYKVSVWVRTSAGGMGLNLGSSNLIDTGWVTSDQWTQYQATFTTGQTNLSLSLAGMDLYIDDFRLNLADDIDQAPSAPTGLELVAKSDTAIKISWEASTDDIAVTGYDIFADGVKLGSTTDQLQYVATDLNASTEYTFTVKAKDAAGNSSDPSEELSVTTNALAPNLITNPGFEDGANGWVLPASVTVSTLDKHLGLASLKLTDWTDLGINATLEPDTTYKVSVWIKTSGGGMGLNLGATSLIDTGWVTNNQWTQFQKTFTTGQSELTLALAGMAIYLDDFEVRKVADLSAPTDTDSTPPTTPANLRTTSKTTTSISLAWDAATDENGSVTYEVYRNQVFLTKVSLTSFEDSGLQAGTEYTYYVIAKDEAANVSQASNQLTVTTDSTGGNSTPQTSDNTTTSTQTQTQTAGTISVNANKIGTTVEVKLDASIINKAFEETKTEAQGIKTIQVDIKAIEGVKEYSLQLPKSVFSTDKPNGEVEKTIEIRTALGTVTVPDNMFKESDLTKSENVGISIGIADTSKLDNETKAKIAAKPVIEINALIDGKVVSWKNNNAPVTLSVDYEPTAEEWKNLDAIVVWYIDGNGKIKSVPSGRYDAATGTVSFKTTHFSKYAVVYNIKSFSDTGKIKWAQKQIDAITAKGIMSGTAENMFNPQDNITRAEFIDALIKTLGLTTDFDKNFSDVDSTNEYYEAIGVAKKLGITYGTGNNKFSPGASITRQEMSTLVIKAMEVAGKNYAIGNASDLKKFSDSTKVASYAVEAMASLVKEGFLVGNGTGIGPRDTFTRAQAAVVMYKVYNK